MRRIGVSAVLFVCLLIVLVVPHFAFGAAAACNLNATTANFASQLAAAQPGQTLCLASGNYGTFSGAEKSSPGVTITIQSGATATMFLSFRQTSPIPAWLILDGITVSGGDISGPTHDVTFRNLTFTDKVNIYSGANNNACSNCPGMNNNNIVFDNVLFNMAANPSGANGFEGRFNVVGGGATPAGVTIRNSKFTTGCADGVQFNGGGNGITIGPNNEFFNLQQGSCGPHVDSIQFVGTSATGPLITGNYFHDDSTGIIGYDNANDATITNNLVVNIANDGTAIAGNATGTISHNTLPNNQLSCGQTHQGNVCRSAFINNIATGISLDGGGPGAPSQNDYNLCTDGPCTGGGSHSFTGTPTYVGGSSPNTYAGFALTSTSPGHNAANDGKDMGINTTASSPAPPPTANPPDPPTNLRGIVQ